MEITVKQLRRIIREEVSAAAPESAARLPMEGLIGKTVADIADVTELEDPSISWSETAAELNRLAGSDTYTAPADADDYYDEFVDGEYDDDALDALTDALTDDLDEACQDLNMKVDDREEIIGLAPTIARRLMYLLRTGEGAAVVEGRRLSEGLRTPSELGRILKKAPIGYVLDYVRVFRGPRGDAKVGVITKVAKDGKPGAYTFKVGRSVQEFDTADGVAYGIGDFDVL